MKCKLTLLLLLFFVMAEAQWSNTTNQFYDSLHSFVCKAPQDQINSISLKSYPDSGYIVIWEDRRVGVSAQDIYAQKYDKNGIALWAPDGVPVATGPDFQTFVHRNFDNVDYRNYGHACTDSAGGFYIAWEDYNITATGMNGTHRVCVQHTKDDGSNVFPGIGKILAEPEPGRNNQFEEPELIADGNKGFFVGYIEADNQDVSFRNFYVRCFKEEAGILKYYGGGRIDPDKMQVQENAFPCGSLILRDNIVDVDDRVQHFNIFPDGNNGCGIVWTFSRNAVAPNGGRYLVSNRLCRVKKNSRTNRLLQVFPVVYNGTTIFSNGIANVETFYPKDTVVLLYPFAAYVEEHPGSCSDGSLSLLTHRRYEIFGEGFRRIETSSSMPTINAWSNPKGVIIPTTGNVDPILYAVNESQFVNTGRYTKAYVYETVEKYDSLPYQLTSNTVYLGSPIITNPPPYLNKVGNYVDTILEAGFNFHDFSIAAANGRVVATALITNVNYNTSGSNIFLQEIKAEMVNSDSFRIRVNTSSKKGVLVAKEISTGFTGTDIFYESPMVTMDKRGNALFYVTEKGRFVKASPVGDNAKLLWGGAGKPTGNSNGPELPFVAMSNDGTALQSWNDSRSIAPGVYTENNILMRHLDSLDIYTYSLPFKKIFTLTNYFSDAFSQIIGGISNLWLSFDMKSSANTWTEVVQVKDNFNLGYTYVQAYKYPFTGIRTFNGRPYLNVNYLIKPTNNPVGTAQVGVRLFFAQEEFDALKLADPSITSPADLQVIKQPSTANALETYSPVAGEETIQPTAWKAVDGGYYLEFYVSSFSNFFIFKGNGILPLTWLNVNAQWKNETQANVSWLVADQKNVQTFFVQYSTDGINFSNECEVAASTNTAYACTVPATKGKLNYYRIMQKDVDRRTTYSKIILLSGTSNQNSIQLFPNPAKDFVTINLNGVSESVEQILLTNAAGAIVWQTKNPVRIGTNIRVPLQNLASGMYLLQISGTKTTSILKVLKE